ncbi:MAG: molecular chaperone DnaK (HSP70), partial [Verrucomicrobiales bacterium]
MKGALFSIGIDLGTTNSALSFTRLDDEYAVSEVFEIPQWTSPTAVGTASTLPSFLYLPTAAEAGNFGAEPDAEPNTEPNWVVGKFARSQAADLPGRVGHSAKSWLCHHAVDRSAPFLPWGSDELSEEEKVSPIHASALILGALRSAWNVAFAELGTQGQFDAQQVTITVPASFDAAAQKLTLEAAQLAGFPEGVQLIEEPQAAFYRWLERFPTRDELHKRLPDLGTRDHYVLIVDVGGGTSDFSLFKLQLGEDQAVPSIERVAVSDHILLGGDNVDLALAHMLAARMGDPDADSDEKLSSKQWHYLVARCRDLKEKALQKDGSEGDEYPISIPGRGANLLADTMTARLKRSELSALLLDGFFPNCPADQVPARSESALKEWGLPFASDSAVTHYLADFLQGQPQVDAVIFNGGALYPKPLRDRLVDIIGIWQGGKVPALLNNPEPDLAVARGAARYGWLTHRKEQRIEAGAARTLYLEVAGENKGDPPSLLCILARGTQPEEVISVERKGLKLRVNQPVRFRAFYSTKRSRDKPGTVLPMAQGKFHPLPSLQTIARVSKNQVNASDGQLPVRLSTQLNALGLLQVSCVSMLDAVEKEWPLEFNLRQSLSASQGSSGSGSGSGSAGGFVREEGSREESEAMAGTMPEGDAGVSDREMVAAIEVVKKVFRQNEKTGKQRKLTLAWLQKELQKALGGVPKHEWNWVLIRSLWPVLEECQEGRKISADHEETWLSFAGYLLRPGFGADLDDLRMEELWQLRQAGLAFPGKRIRLQDYILWRRVSGGLSRERQEAVLQEAMPVLRQQKNPPAELIRMAGALERVGQGLKRELIEMLLGKAVELVQEGAYADPYFVSLTLLLNRAPLYAGPESVVPPELVADAFAACEKFRWDKVSELQTLFL